MKHLIALILALMFCPASMAGAHPIGVPESYPRVSDFQELREWVNKEQSFSQSTRRQALATVKEHCEAARPMTDAEFYMEVRRIVALADNGHSNVTDRPIHQSFGVLPLRLYWFSDGLYVVRARAEQRELLGSRISAVDGIAISEFESRLMQYHGGTQGFFRRYLAPSLVMSPALLHAVGLADKPDRLKLTLTNADGAQRELSVQVDPSSSSVVARPWRYLSPRPIANEQDWVTVRDGQEHIPLYLQDETALFRYEPILDGELIYIQLRANIGSGLNSVRDFVKRAAKRLKEDMPLSIIFDNRQNGGGDLSRTASFARSLPSLTYTDGKVYVLTDSGTFSAGIYSSFYPKASDSEGTIVLGETVGDRARFWAETGPGFQLSESGYRIGYALQLHDVAAGCGDPKLCHMTNYPPAMNLSVGSVEPDWGIATDFASFAAGRDPLMERILAHRDE